MLQQAPRFDVAGAAQLARDLYGFESTASPLPSERDQNFLLVTTAGDRFVLKIANATEALEMLDAQNAAMEHLARSRGSLDFCPRILSTTDGQQIARAPSGHFVRLRHISLPTGPRSRFSSSGAIPNCSERS